jgi:sugar lactone lactonase YvrE
MFVSVIASAVVLACQTEEQPASTETATWSSTQDSTDRVVSVTGLAGPEAVRYDPVGDVYFVSNFNGDEEGDGFISRVSSDGTMETIQFGVGTAAHPLHDPRGMFIHQDTLWAADANGIHGFNRASGEHIAFVDFTAFEPGFLNDIATGPDGTIYVTDTGLSRVYRVVDGEAAIAIEDSMLGQPNGITWDRGGARFLIAPWGGRQQLRAWNPETNEITMVATSNGAFFDGIEFANGRVVVASQADSSLHVVTGETTHLLVHVPGRPADIGLDTRRNRVAVPYIALDRVDIWQLPEA